MWWFVAACVIYGFVTGPMTMEAGATSSYVVRVLILTIIAVPSMIAFYYCVWMGFVSIGVLHR
jgi:hypothetical protein